MKHEIDLEKYQIRTDLALDSIEKENEKIDSNIVKNEDFVITDVYVDEILSKKINKKIGNYTTIEFKDITDKDNYQKILTIFKDKLLEFIKREKLKENDLVLIIGLGNRKSTPDSLGPLVTDNIIVTNHLYELNELEDGFQRTSIVEPKVTGVTGIETSNLIEGIINKINPKLLIVIDSLASLSIERVNKTIQMTDTGIHPGSGIGNSRKEISKDVLGVPVIAIGVPTVVDASTIVSDTIKYIYNHYAYMKSINKTPISKLSTGIIKSKYKDIKIDEKDKKELFGLLGLLNEDETKKLIYEVLSPSGYNLMVTPKEIDFTILKLSTLIADAINKALHKNI